MSRLSHYLASTVIVVVLVEEKSTTGYFSFGFRTLGYSTGDCYNVFISGLVCNRRSETGEVIRAISFLQVKKFIDTR